MSNSIGVEPSKHNPDELTVCPVNYPDCGPTVEGQSTSKATSPEPLRDAKSRPRRGQ